MDTPPLPSPDEEALLRELSDLLGDLPEVTDDPGAGHFVAGVAGAHATPAGTLVDGPPLVPGHVADEHRPALAGMVRSLNERISRARTAPTSAAEDVAAERYLTFSIGPRRYGMPLRNVVEVGRVLPVVPLPHVPGWLLGLANLRGRVIAVLDLAALLGGAERLAGAARRLIVVRPTGGEVFGAVIVDAVHRIREFAAGSLRPAETVPEWVDPACLAGFCDEDGELVALLDMTRLLLSEALQQFAASREAWRRVT